MIDKIKNVLVILVLLASAYSLILLFKSNNSSNYNKLIINVDSTFLDKSLINIMKKISIKYKIDLRLNLHSSPRDNHHDMIILQRKNYQKSLPIIILFQWLLQYGLCHLMRLAKCH